MRSRAAAVVVLALAASGAAAPSPAPSPSPSPSPSPTPAPPRGPSAQVVDTLKKADEAFKAERWADAVASYERVLALRTDSPVTIHQQIGVAQVHLKDYARALDHLQKVLDADPLNVPVRVLMAKAALAGGMLDRGLAMLATIDDRGIRAPDVFYDIAVHFVNANQPAQAISYFTKAIMLDPAYADAYFRRAMARLQIGQTDGAKADLRKVVELKPDGPQADAARDALVKLR